MGARQTVVVQPFAAGRPCSSGFFRIIRGFTPARLCRYGSKACKDDNYK